MFASPRERIANHGTPGDEMILITRKNAEELKKQVKLLCEFETKRS